MLAVFSVAAIVGGYLLVARSMDLWPFVSVETTPTHTESETIDPDSKARSSSASNENVDVSKTTDQIPVTEAFSVTIMSLGQNSGQVSYTADVKGAETGTCSAVFTNDIGKPVILTTDVSGGKCSASTTAAAFDAIGIWKLTLRVYSNDTQALDTRDLQVQ